MTDEKKTYESPAVRRIQSYDDLVEERKRLENLLVVHRKQIETNWEEVKEEFKPVNNIISFFSKLTTRDRTNPLVNMGIDLAGDVVLRKFILGRAGWLTKLAVPFLVKNYSSNMLADKGKSLISRVKHFLHRNKNGTPQSAATPGTPSPAPPPPRDLNPDI